jgi:hypothetical protein
MHLPSIISKSIDRLREGLTSSASLRRQLEYIFNYVMNYNYVICLLDSANYEHEVIAPLLKLSDMNKISSAEEEKLKAHQAKIIQIMGEWWRLERH